MGMGGLLELVEGLSAYRSVRYALAAAAPSEGPQRLTVPDAARACLVAALWRGLGSAALVVAPRPDSADRLANELATWLGPADGASGDASPVLRWPESEALPFERLAEDSAVAHGRLRILSTLSRDSRTDAPAPDSAERSPSALENPDTHEGQGPALVGAGHALPGQGPVLVGSVEGLLQRTIPPATFQAGRHVIRVGDTVQVSALLSRWTALGYEVEAAVEVPGAASRRGGILDIFPPHLAQPVRIELFGDTVESIRAFDPVTQRSEEAVDEVEVIPASEQALGPQEGAKGETPAAGVRSAADLLARLAADDQPTEAIRQMRGDLERLLAGEALPESGLYAGLFREGSLLDYLPGDTLVVLVDPDRGELEAAELEEQGRAARSARVERGDLPEGFPSPWWTWEQTRAALDDFPRRLRVDWRPSADEGDLGILPAPSFWGQLGTFAPAVAGRVRGGARVVVLSASAERLVEVLSDYEVGSAITEDLSSPPEPGSVTIVPTALAEGFLLPLESGSLALFTDGEVFGQAKRRRVLRRHALRREAFLAELVPGSYVVHVDHGIGRFVGTRQVGGEQGEREYLTIEYAEGDRLHVPTDHLDRLTPYVAPGDSAPTLTRLGTQEWARAKDRARTAARQMAEELVALYAARQVLPGRAFPPDTLWQREMEDAFPYTETRDQAEAIDAVKEAMEAPHPMDHLVCGDVGYGKTEIAIRAAFKAVQDGMQAALLCPTTVLAQQHYATFAERLRPFPVKVEVLSRFRTPQEQHDVIEKLRTGEVDIIIGTHRLVQKDVVFKDLGLVVVDDEQRFGVAQKEWLKRLRQEIDVLTLTATPIPRTLSMALAGIRDMSTIHTPPEQRRPVRTFVSEYADDLTREAVLRELDRGGQVFFVHNRIRDIHEWAAKIQELAPQARVTVGHGRMHEDELAAVMADFMAGKADVLVCTTIIEAGLDLPNVNTIIVHRPELLGLAQMYQLRGRVGRGDRSALAYFLTPPGRQITEAAEKRLKAILAYQELGAGFRIAMKDLEIRGAGNILGPEQSGHLHAVGFDLYTRLLEEAVADLREGRGEQPSEARRRPPPQVAVSLPLQAFIPDEYLPDLPQRLGVYQRLALASDTEEVVVLGEELRDRFGPPPEPVANLLYTVRVKVLAAAAGVEAVTREGDQIALRLKEPVGGARPLLQRELGPVATVGQSLVRVPTRGRWTEVVAWTLERMAAFRERVLGMAGE